MSELIKFYSKKFKNFFVFYRIVCLEGSLIDWKTSKGSCFSFGYHGCDLELSNNWSCFLSQDGIGDQKLVFQTFLDSYSCSNGVFEGVEWEAEGRIVVKNFIEKYSALLDFQVVSSVHGSFVNCASCIQLFCLSFSTWNYYIKSNHIIHCKLLRIYPLLEGFLVYDHLVTVNQVFFQLMGKNSFQGVDVVRGSYFLDNLSYFVVGVSWLNESESSLSGLVCCQDHISFFANNGSIFVRLNDKGMGDKRGKSINMDTELYFDKISFLDVDWVFLEGWEMSADLVDGDGCGEGHSFEDSFFIIDFGEFLVDLVVAPEAEFEDFTAYWYLFDEFSEYL